MQGNPYHCDHETTETRRRTYSNGSTHFVVQCLRCGAQLSSLKHSTVENPDILSSFDESLSEQFNSQARAARMGQHTDERAEWQAWYNEYLNSPAWAQRRIEVLRRDQRICQGCRKRKATEVHHLTYAHVGNEFLFELTSLCSVCHERIHADD